MNIAIFIPQLKGGGAERMMVNLANGLVELGINVYFICASFEGPYCKELSNKVNVIDFKKDKTSKCILLLYRQLNIIKPACLITTQAHAILTAVIAAKFLGNKFKLIIREATTPSEAVKRKTKSVVNALRNSLLKALYKKADLYVAVSNGVKEDIIAHYGISSNLIHVIPNPVITADINAKKNIVNNHPFFDENEGNTVLIGVGRIHDSKDFGTLIKAFNIVRKTKKAKLLLLGDTGFNKSEYNRITNLIEEFKLSNDVDFTGFVDNPFSYLYRSDVFVLSSLYEGMPGVIVQAMYCGCQIVSTDCKHGPREITKEGSLGALVEVGDYNQMAEAILNLLDNPISPESLIIRALDFDYLNSTKEYLKLVERVIN